MLRKTLLTLTIAVFLMGVLAGSLPSPAPTHAQDGSPADNMDVVLEVVARINQYRVARGLSPLVLNSTLMAMAQDQAEYVTSLNPLPQGGELHIGPAGEYPAARAVQRYDWPTYGRRSQVDIGENAGIGSVSFAMDYWEGSTTHRQTMANASYREIGVGVMPHQFGYLLIVVFGGRPNVLPVTYHPLEEQLYLSNDSYAHGNLARVENADTVRLFDAEGRPRGAAQDWSATLALPADPGERLTVMMSDGEHTVARIVDLRADVVILPDTLAYLPDTPAASVAATEEAEDEPAAEDESPDAATPDADNTSAPPAATATPEAPAPAVLIEYDAASLDLVNVTDGAINVFDLVLVSGETRFPVTRWAQYVNVPLNRLPAGVCLQVWSWNEDGVLPVPASCQARASYLTLSPAALFWQDGFTVELNGETLADCPAGGGECAVTLPE